MIDPTNTLVSEATQERLGRAQFEYRRALEEYMAAWSAMVREQYAREQGSPDRGEDCSDLG